MNQDRIERAKKMGTSRFTESERFETVVGMAAGMAPIIELTGGGVLERHPELRFVVTEAECGWLAWVLQAMDQMQERRGLYVHSLPMRASDYFRRQGAVTISDDPVALHNVEFTGVDGLLWGNDYPHDEGTWPNSAACLDGIKAKLSPEDAEKVLWGNAARLYDFDIGYLAAQKPEIAALA
jgi:predicted TIM-barrel fold metal-dependent hydrolase